jgi:RimJ/RimL family protein N-acetyltransferase
LNKIKSVCDIAFRGYGIELHPVAPSDLSSLRRWRNSPEISRQMANDSYISAQQQLLWYERIKERSDQTHWVVWYKKIKTGYLNIKGEGPIESQEKLSGGYYLWDSSVRHGLLGYATALMFHDIVFDYFSATEVRDTVLKSNYRARKLNKMFGYFEGQEFDKFIEISVTHSRYKTAKMKIARYFGDEAICRLIQTES